MKTRTSNAGCSTLSLVKEMLLALQLSEVPSDLCASISSRWHTKIISSSIDPNGYSREMRNEFIQDYFACEVLSKYDSLRVTVDRRKVALEKFMKAEDDVRAADSRLRYSLKLPDKAVVEQIILSARRKIETCLGPFDWNEVYTHTSFGPGASIGVPRSRSERVQKYGNLNPSVTPDCLDLAVCAVRMLPSWEAYLRDGNASEDPRQWFSIVKGNKVVTVPKNAKTDRVIAIEPQMNMYIQKGLGSVIRKRLRRYGCNLNDQSRNQELARLGSITGDLATVDLSSASDTISLYLVEKLLPQDWYDALCLTRSPYGVMPDGTEVMYRKVSSMGNGFTFELESLIFLSLVRAVLDSLGLFGTLHGVYGDDIVIDASAVELLKEVFEFVGFKFNDKKTFYLRGTHFRESCGKHYFAGSDVTPFYVREDIEGVERLIWFANNIRAFAHRLVGQGYGCDRKLEGVWNRVVSMIPSKLRSKLRGPLWVKSEVPTSFIGSNFDEVCPSRASFGIDGYDVPSLKRRYRTSLNGNVPTLIAWLDYHRDYQRPFGEVRMSRSQNSAYRLVVSKQLVLQWQDCGPWVDWS